MRLPFFSSRPTELLIQDSYEIIQACAKYGWSMSKFQYYTMLSISQQISSTGTDEQKKQYCRILHEAVKRTIITPTPDAGLFIKLIGDVRNNCPGLFTDESSYSDVNMDFSALDKITAQSTAASEATTHHSFVP